MVNKLTAWLIGRGYSQTLADKAVFELVKTAGNLQQGLYKTNQDVSRKRLEVIAEDVIAAFDSKNRLADGNGNAMLVADSIYAACKYYEIFQSRGFKMRDTLSF